MVADGVAESEVYRTVVVLGFRIAGESHCVAVDCRDGRVCCFRAAVMVAKLARVGGDTAIVALLAIGTLAPGHASEAMFPCMPS